MVTGYITSSKPFTELIPTAKPFPIGSRRAECHCGVPWNSLGDPAYRGSPKCHLGRRHFHRFLHLSWNYCSGSRPPGCSARYSSRFVRGHTILLKKPRPSPPILPLRVIPLFSTRLEPITVPCILSLSVAMLKRPDVARLAVWPGGALKVRRQLALCPSRVDRRRAFREWKSKRSASTNSGSLSSRLSDAAYSPAFPEIDVRPGPKKRLFRRTCPPPTPTKSIPWQSPPPSVTALR